MFMFKSGSGSFKLPKDENCRKTETKTKEEEMEKMKEENERLTNEIKELREKLQEQQLNIQSLQQEIKKQTDILLHVPTHGLSSGSGRRYAIIGEPITKPEYDPPRKTAEQIKFLKRAMNNNTFLARYDEEQRRILVNYMKEIILPENSVPVAEGTTGDSLYVIAQGNCAVTQGSKHIGTLTEGDFFGELAMLYGCCRTATVKAITRVKAWFIDKKAFLYAVSKASKDQRAARVDVLSNIQFLYSLKNSKIQKIADAMEEEEYTKGDYLIREGEYGDVFFIIKNGEVVVKEWKNGRDEEIRYLSANQCFGEKALQNDNNIRTASIIATSEIVRVYTLDKRAFVKLIGKAQITWSPKLSGKPHRKSSSSILEYTPKSMLPELVGTKLGEDYQPIDDLGSGSYGSVKLVRLKKTQRVYALKCIYRKRIVDRNLQKHIIAERNILASCDSTFIVKLFRTFKNKKYVYMLQEACRGGDVWSHLKNCGHFSESRTKFYSACVIEALDYLHSARIVHRDIKPENLLVDKRGYVKLCDFGLAKQLQSGERTFSLVGTPQYISPEILLNKGHDNAVDYWALGILIFELLTGRPPFEYNQHTIERGIDGIDMPIGMHKSVKNLIKRLCRENPFERLGYLAEGIGGIRRHKWFVAFDWNGLRKGHLTPEFIPVLRSNIERVRMRSSSEREDSSADNEKNEDPDETNWADEF